MRYLLFETDPIQLIFGQHCCYWWPGASASIISHSVENTPMRFQLFMYWCHHHPAPHFSIKTPWTPIMKIRRSHSNLLFIIMTSILVNIRNILKLHDSLSSWNLIGGSAALLLRRSPNSKAIEIFNSSPPGQNGRHFRRRHFQMRFHEWKKCISIRISLKFVPRGSIDNMWTLVQVMAWRRIGDKPLPESMPIQFTDAYMRHKGGNKLSLKSSNCDTLSDEIVRRLNEFEALIRVTDFWKSNDGKSKPKWQPFLRMYMYSKHVLRDDFELQHLTPLRMHFMC